jgi:hypothetical protein
VEWQQEMAWPLEVFGQELFFSYAQKTVTDHNKSSYTWYDDKSWILLTSALAG